MAVRKQIKGFEFDRQINIQTNTPTTDEHNQEVDSWANTYTNIYAKEIKAIGGEVQQADQQVFEQKRAWIITKENMTITNKMRVVYDSENYDLYDVRPWKASRELIVLEGVLRK